MQISKDTLNKLKNKRYCIKMFHIVENNNHNFSLFLHIRAIRNSSMKGHQNTYSSFLLHIFHIEKKWGEVVKSDTRICPE